MNIKGSSYIFRHISLCLFFFRACLHAQGSTTVLWQGTQIFDDWGDVVNIDGSYFTALQDDDILKLTLDAESSAQLQISYGNSWACFSGLEAMSISGNYDMVVTSETASLLQQGIHIKGVGYTLRQVCIVANDGTYVTNNDHLFTWDDLLTSGATRGNKSIVTLQAYGGAGWYWHDGTDFSTAQSIHVSLLQPATESIIVQLLYAENGVLRQTIDAGSSECTLQLNSEITNAYSLSIMSQKAQTVALGSVNITENGPTDAPTLVSVPEKNDDELISDFFTPSGIALSHPINGITIRRATRRDGTVYTRKNL